MSGFCGACGATPKNPLPTKRRRIVRESVSDSGYGHNDISCMTYDIHVDTLLECVFSINHCMKT